MEKQIYSVSYTYQNPGRGGPFLGRDKFDWKPAKGDQIRAIFGMAIVKTVSKVKTINHCPHGYGECQTECAYPGRCGRFSQ